jgi:hypothetical protein
MKMQSSPDPRAMIQNVNNFHKWDNEQKQLDRRRSEAKTKAEFFADLVEIDKSEVVPFVWHQVVIDGVSRGQLFAMTPLGSSGMIEIIFQYNEYTDMGGLDFDIFLSEDSMPGEYMTIHKDRISIWKLR